ncbi:hypothetical protein CHUAL_003150 [Chamberlinius hualienensis]
MMSKVGNQTNSNDPMAVNSRVFVGNLNTYQVSKEDVERLFKRYGRIGGISMHKGYAFVQFSNPYDARNAVSSEDGNVVCGQMLDVNMVAEPKLHQTGRKRQNLTNTGNDWDYYYDSYNVQSHAQQQLQQQQRLTPPNKRARMGTTNSGQKQRVKSGKSSKSNGVNNSIVVQTTPAAATNNKTSNHYAAGTTYHRSTSGGSVSSGTADILICGNCKELFSGVKKLLDHKKARCKLRFACRCRAMGERKNSSDESEPASFLCAVCKDKFESAWNLLEHVQSSHDMNIYELPSTSSESGNANNATTGSNASIGGGASGAEEGGSTSIKEEDDDDNAADDLAMDGSSCGTPEELDANEQY